MLRVLICCLYRLRTCRCGLGLLVWIACRWVLLERVVLMSLVITGGLLFKFCGCCDFGCGCLVVVFGVLLRWNVL